MTRRAYKSAWAASFMKTEPPPLRLFVRRRDGGIWEIQQSKRAAGQKPLFHRRPFGFVTAVHKDVTDRLHRNNPQLYAQVKEVLEHNKQERHIRGGMATRRKYKGD